MGKVELYYSSEITEPWCDLEEIRGLLGKLKEKSVSVGEIDTAKIPEGELKRYERPCRGKYPNSGGIRFFICSGGVIRRGVAENK